MGLRLWPLGFGGLLCLWAAAGSTAQELPAHLFSEVFFCQPGDPSLGLAQALDQEPLFRFNFSTQQWRSILPELQPEEGNRTSLDQVQLLGVICQDILQFLTNISEAYMPEAKEYWGQTKLEILRYHRIEPQQGPPKLMSSPSGRWRWANPTLWSVLPATSFHQRSASTGSWTASRSPAECPLQARSPQSKAGSSRPSPTWRSLHRKDRSTAAPPGAPRTPSPPWPFGSPRTPLTQSSWRVSCVAWPLGWASSSPSQEPSSPSWPSGSGMQSDLLCCLQQDKAPTVDKWPPPLLLPNPDSALPAPPERRPDDGNSTPE